MIFQQVEERYDIEHEECKWSLEKGGSESHVEELGTKFGKDRDWRCMKYYSIIVMEKPFFLIRKYNRYGEIFIFKEVTVMEK